MGAVASADPSLLPDFEKPHWVSDLRHAKHLISRFDKLQSEFGFAMTLETFSKLYERHLIPSDEVRRVFDIWDSQKKHKVDALQIFAGTICVCRASFDEKVSALFKLFDMDMNESISRDEMTILIRATLNGYCRMTGMEPPSMSELAELARIAFQNADSVEYTDNKIDLSELIAWARKTPESVSILSRFGPTTDKQEVFKLLRLMDERSRMENNNSASHHTFRPPKPPIPTIKSLTSNAFPSMNHSKNNNNHHHHMESSSSSSSSSRSSSHSSSFPSTSASTTSSSINENDQRRLNDIRKLKLWYDSLDVHNSNSVDLHILNANAHLLKKSHPPVFRPMMSDHHHPHSPKNSSKHNNNNPNTVITQLSFRHVVRSCYPDLRSSQIDPLVEAVQVQPIPSSLVTRIKHVFDECDRDFSGRVSLVTVLAVLAPSTKLLEYGVHVEMPKKSEAEKTITLHGLLTRLFAKTHPKQMQQILGWGKPSKVLTPEQKRDLQVLFEMYDTDASGNIDISELKNSVQLALPDADFHILFKDFDSNSDNKISLHEFQKFYRNVWDSKLDFDTDITSMLHKQKQNSKNNPP